MILPISKLLDGRPLPVCVKSNQTIREALVLMVEKDFSQLPVISDSGDLLGIVSQESILKRYFHMDGEIPVLDLPINHCQSPVITLQMGDDISTALAQLQMVYAVVIVDDSGDRPIGILTDYDIAHFFWGYTQELLIARNIETNLRMVILKTFSDEDELNAALLSTFGEDKNDPGLPRKSMGRLAFGDLMRVITHKNNWEKFENIFGPKEVFEKLMHLARSTRNKVAHLEEEVSVLEKDALRNAQHWFEFRPTIHRIKPSEIRASDLVKAKATQVSSTNKYEPLRQYLEAKRIEGENRLSLKFEDIETLLGQDLPESARMHRAWWGNHYNNPQAASWMKSGWLVDSIDSGTDEVSFRVSRSAFYPFIFSDLLEELKEARPGITSSSKVSMDNWQSFSAGATGLSYAWVLPREPVLRVELYIDKGDQNENKEIFDYLFSNREMIEQEIGKELTWDRLDTRRASRISITRPFDVMDVDENSEQAKQWGVDVMLKFVDVFQPYIIRPTRKSWNEQSYFEDVENKLSTKEADAVRKVYNAALNFADRIDWGTGVEKGSFNPKVFAISIRSLFTIYSDGVLTLNYSWLDEDDTTHFGEKLKIKLLSLELFRKTVKLSGKKYPSVPIADWLPFVNEFIQIIIEFVAEYRDQELDTFTDEA